ncbi:MAG: hypothetical protein R2711_19300 [Acidimicrobiales bacterium]
MLGDAAVHHLDRDVGGVEVAGSSTRTSTSRVAERFSGASSAATSAYLHPAQPADPCLPRRQGARLGEAVAAERRRRARRRLVEPR